MKWVCCAVGRWVRGVSVRCRGKREIIRQCSCVDWRTKRPDLQRLFLEHNQCVKHLPMAQQHLRSRCQPVMYAKDRHNTVVQKWLPPQRYYRLNIVGQFRKACSTVLKLPLEKCLPVIKRCYRKNSLPWKWFLCGIAKHLFTKPHHRLQISGSGCLHHSTLDNGQHKHFEYQCMEHCCQILNMS